MVPVLHSIADPRLAVLLMGGQVGVIPTDTIYGLALRASDPEAVARLARLKEGGEHYKPGTIIAASARQLIDLGVDEAIIRSVEHLWPNPLSLELPIGKKLAYLYQDGPHRAFRVVADPVLQLLLEKTGPLLTSSVNPHGQPQANTIDEARHYFGDRVDFYVDGGDLSDRPPSTVARVRDGRIEVLRQGAVTIDKKGNIL